MKKTAILIVMLCLLLAFSACGIQSSSINDQENDKVEVGQDRFVVDDAAFVPQMLYTFTQEEYNVAVFHMGKINDVPISYNGAVFYKGTEEIDLTYEKSTLSESLVESSKNIGTSETVAVNAEKWDEVSLGFDFLIEGGELALKTSFGANFLFNIKTCQGQSLSKGYTINDIYTTAKSYSIGSTETINIVIDSRFEPGYYYRLSLFADCDVYAFAVYNSTTQEVSISFDLSAIPGSYYYALEKNEDNEFKSTNAYQDKLVFDVDLLNDFDFLNYRYLYAVNYELNGGAFEGEVSNTYLPATVSLPEPVKENYAFDGWYSDSNFTNLVDNQTLANTPQDVTLYAKWVSTKYEEASAIEADIYQNGNYRGMAGCSWNAENAWQVSKFIEKGYTTFTIELTYTVELNGDPTSIGFFIGVDDGATSSNIELKNNWTAQSVPTNNNLKENWFVSGNNETGLRSETITYTGDITLLQGKYLNLWFEAFKNQILDGEDSYKSKGFNFSITFSK